MKNTESQDDVMSLLILLEKRRNEVEGKKYTIYSSDKMTKLFETNPKEELKMRLDIQGLTIGKQNYWYTYSREFMDRDYYGYFNIVGKNFTLK